MKASDGIVVGDPPALPEVSQSGRRDHEIGTRAEIDWGYVEEHTLECDVEILPAVDAWCGVGVAARELEQHRGGAFLKVFENRAIDELGMYRPRDREYIVVKP